MKKYIYLAFDPTDTQDQFAIVHPNHYCEGSPLVEWFDTEESRAIEIDKYQKQGFTILDEAAL